MRPTLGAGGVAGGAVTLGFLVVHEVVISSIWFNAGPMIVSGVLCGVCIVWSYNAFGREHSPSRWWGYNLACVAALVGLGFGSIVTMEPQFTMAELMAMDDPLDRLMPLAVMPMILGTVLATPVLWWLFSRRAGAMVPIFVTQALLMLLIGHNLAILGAVEIPQTMLYVVGEFIGLTVFLGVAFAMTAALIMRLAVRPSTG